MGMKKQIYRIIGKKHIYEILKKNDFLQFINKKIQAGPMQKLCNKVQKYGYSIIEEVYGIFADLNLDIWVDWGTLLGYIREQRILLHDDDIDFSAYMMSEQKRNELIEIMSKCGYVQVREWHDGDKVIMDTFEKYGVRFDIEYQEVVSENKICTVIFEKEEQTRSYFEKEVEIIEGMGRYIYETSNPAKVIIECFANGKRCPLPNNYTERVAELYGPNWRIPVIDFDWHDINNYMYEGFDHNLGGWMIR